MDIMEMFGRFEEIADAPSKSMWINTWQKLETRQ